MTFERAQWDTRTDSALVSFQVPDPQQAVLWEVLQLCRNALISLADMVLAPSVAGLFKWRQFEPEMILLAVGWYLRFHCRTVMSRNSLLSVDFWSTTSRSGGGPTLCVGNSAPIANAAPTDQRQLAGG
jgi:hypothetical protein